MVNSRCGWAGSIRSFLALDESEFLSSLITHQKEFLNSQIDPGQHRAWRNCFSSLSTYLDDLCQSHPDVLKWFIIFEYVLPRERGRRPDVVILSKDQIFILEYKDYQEALQPHIDQVAAYSRDVQNYHGLSHNNPVHSILVLNQAQNISQKSENVFILSPDKLNAVIPNFIDNNKKFPNIDPLAWIDAEYEPLPSLVTAARNIFNHEPLPNIRKAQSAGIPQTLEELVNIAHQAKKNNQHHLALITGVPGSGKTLVGLQFVYLTQFDDEKNRPAVLLSGNDPLVKVLQHALQNRIFVQDVHGFLRDYGGGSQRIPEENIFVYDEAQRAWDQSRVKAKRGKAISEPEDFLQIGGRKPWSLMVGLIGQGQEIHLGEEAGLRQWNDAISKVGTPWIVNCPQRISHFFTAASTRNNIDSLDLTLTLRSHLAQDLQAWVTHLLNNEIIQAFHQSTNVIQSNFQMYITRDLNIAKSYVQERYRTDEDKRYGLLASSKAKCVPDFGIHNEYNYTRNLRVGPWYNDPPHSPNSCCQLRDVATEFSCQGLELDFPIISWGDDLYWDQAKQLVSVPQPRSNAKDPHQLRVNSYRVLLTRGRDGFIVFLPKLEKLDQTYSVLLEAGVQEL